MDKREAQEVVNETVSGRVGGYIIALIVIAALPIIGWALLIGLLSAVAFPGAAALIATCTAQGAAWRQGPLLHPRRRRDQAFELQPGPGLAGPVTIGSPHTISTG
jgi:hypothetical protein